MRTLEQFSSKWEDLKWFVTFHNKSVWLVPLEDTYTLSVVPPQAKHLPFGTASNLYNTELEIVDTIVSNKE